MPLKLSRLNKISAKIKSNWHYKSVKDSWVCNAHVMQNAKGKIQDVYLKNCIVDDEKSEKFKELLKKAIYLSSPLPLAPAKEVIFPFRVN